MSMRYNAVINKEGGWYIARCLEIPVTTQGRTIEEAQANLKEAIQLYIESFPEDELPERTGEIMLYPVEVATGA